MTAAKNCGSCRYWSEMLAQAMPGRPVEAMCLGAGPFAAKYTSKSQVCGGWAENIFGAIDDPGSDNDEAYAALERQGVA